MGRTLAPGSAERISLAQLDELVRADEPALLLDVRSAEAYRESTVQAAGAIRVPPNGVIETITRLGVPYDTWLVSYCT